MTLPIRVVVVSECLFSAECLALGLATASELSVTSLCGRADIVPALLQRFPQLVLIHFPSDFPATLELTRAIADRLPEVRVVVAGIADSEAKILECIEAGASGWVSRGGSLEDLHAMIQAASQGQMICSPQLAYRMFGRLNELAANNLLTEGLSTGLTIREMEIMDLVADGKSNEQIAAALYISVNTVKKHVHNILEKLRTGSRAQLTAGLS